MISKAVFYWRTLSKLETKETHARIESWNKILPKIENMLANRDDDVENLFKWKLKKLLR